MLRRLPTAALIACLGVGVAAAPAGAAGVRHHPRPRSAATYKVTFHAAMTEQWSYAEDYRDDCERPGDYCARTPRGSGTASAVLDTPRPQTCMNVRGAAGRPPGLCLGEG